MRNLIITVVAVLLSTAFIAQNINTEKSVIGFSVTNMKVNTVYGTMNGISGNVFFDPGNPAAASFNVKIDASKVNTGTDLRDEHLRDRENLLFVSMYPTINFKSSKIEKTEEGFSATGWLTIKGIKKKVVIPFKQSEKDSVFALTGNFAIDRNDYTIGEGTGSLMIGNEIEINIICVYDKELVSD